MAFCTRCGKELPEGAAFCACSGMKRGLATKGNRLRTGERKARWFLVGLVVILALGGILYVVEQASLPFELRVQIASAKLFRELPDQIQRDIARQEGKTIEELSTSPYDRWAPKVLVVPLAVWGGAWGAYLAYSFFRFVDKETPRDSPTKQLPLRVE